MSMARFKVVAMFLLAVLFAMMFWNFTLHVFLPHHADNAIAQGLVAVT
jgi:hypothetical protein